MRYRINSRRVTFAEFRTEASLLQACLGWLVTRLINIPSSSEYPAVDSLAAYYVSKEEVPEEVRAVFQEAKHELKSVGFVGTIYHRIDDPIQRSTTYFASLLHKSGGVIARLKYRVVYSTTPNRTIYVKEFISLLRTGEFIITSSSLGDLRVSESHDLKLMPKAPISDLWSVHSERIADPRIRGTLSRIASGNEVLATIESHHRQVVESLVTRGIFVPTKDDAVQAKPIPSSTAASASTPLLLAEIEKIQDKPPASWAMSLLLVAASLVLFLAVGGIAWSWKFALLLVPILLFHEAGHYFAMKLFDYRNVQMFFIPLFGAAVSGRHFNVPGWKRVVTSLMGPVPGIILGIGLGIVALIQEHAMLLEAAQLMLFVNGFNLIPSLPLDGGWVAHGLLFSRHAFLDLIFRLLAIGLLLFLGVVGGGRISMFIGIAMLVALPAAFRIARITDRLRATKSLESEAIDGRIPEPAAERISMEIDRDFPRSLDIRAKAKLVLQIFENVNSRPPGWLGTLALGGIYLAAFCTALVAGTIFTLAGHADLGRLVADAAFEPKHDLTVEQIIRHPEGSTVQLYSAPETLVVNFADSGQAARAAAPLRQELGPDSPFLVYGNSIFVPLVGESAATRKRELFARFDAAGDEVHVSSDEFATALRLKTIAPSPEVAQKITESAEAYFQITTTLRLVPPWHPELSVTEEQIVSRQTVLKLQQMGWSLDGLEDQDLYKEIGTAQRSGDHDRLAKLQAEMLTRRKERSAKRLDELRTLPPNEIDHAIVKRYQHSVAEREADDNEESEVLSPDAAKWLGDLAPRLGQLPSQEASGGTDAKYGSVLTNGPILTFFATFSSPGSGALSLTNWLDQQGCAYYKYEISAGGVDLSPEEF
jgi:Zn-dependent protease